MIGDRHEPDSGDSTQDGYDSQALLDHSRGAEDNSFESLLLEEVDLRDNRLTYLPFWLFRRFPFLRCVDASRNRVDRLPLAVWACTSLVELKLSNNCLSSLSCAQIESLHLQVDTDVDQGLDTPVLCSSENSLQSDIMTVLSSTTDSEHRSVDVRHLERWHGRVEVHPVTYLGGMSSARSSQTDHRRSQLKELDLSHNEFDEVPSILPCVAPLLERLNLSHNRLTKFGAVDCYPASLRLLDLSFNQISVMDLMEDGHSSNVLNMSTPVPVPTQSPVSSASRPCCSPFLPKRFVAARFSVSSANLPSML